MTDGLWQNAALVEPPTDRPVLMLARLNTDGEKVGPVVAFWHPSEEEWRPTVNDLGTELIVFYWMDIPELPG
jgi:hypothetical protein